MRSSSWPMLCLGLCLLWGAALSGRAAAESHLSQAPSTTESVKEGEKSSSAEQGAASRPQAVASPGQADATPGQATVKLLGFRSAQFGMDESAVRAAIVKDFGVPASAIHKTQNLGDRTDLLTVRVPDGLPGGGTSDVAYAFGYTSKKLTQVSVIWSQGTDKAITPERLLANGEALKNYFEAAGYDPKSIATNAVVSSGILLFRGTDAEGHTTAMMLHGSAAAGRDKGTQTFVPNALLLFYLADPKAPDVFKIHAGRF